MELIPIQKAKAMYNYYDDLLNKDFMNPIINHNQLIECALIAIKLHLEELSKMKLIFSDRELHYKHWQEVKQEIENL